MQSRLILFLGHPIYSLSVIPFVLLLAAAVVIAMAAGIASSFWTGVASYALATAAFRSAARRGAA